MLSMWSGGCRFLTSELDMRKPRQEHDPERTKKLNSFLRDAFTDYVAARVLFLSRLPQQGATLSSTAIEKCIKAVMAFQGNESHGHLKAAHWNFLKSFDKSVFGKIDDDFLRLNQRAYSLRYTDDLPVDFNLVIARVNF